MNVIQKYIAYLKDNPKRYWFKRKLYGWGWTPARAQGWLVLLAYIVAVVFFVVRAEEEVALTDITREVFVPIIVLTMVLIIICYKTGEKPKWQWGTRLD